jgi:hypothetical protein
MKLTLLSSLLALTSTSLATTSIGTIVEPKTNISFTAYSDATSGYTFGIALPTTPTTDFIGYLAGKGVGWSGVSLGGPMTNKLLVAAWPNKAATGVVGSFREVAYVFLRPFPISHRKPLNSLKERKEQWKN